VSNNVFNVSLGDSGGPLKDVRGGFLAGIVSYGPITRCTNPTQHAVYTEVASYRRWIYRTARKLAAMNS